MSCGMIAVVAVLTVTACSSEEGEPLAHQIDDAREHLAALQSEVEAHADAARVATDLEGWQGVEVHHDEVMQEHMDALDHAIGDMGMCGGVSEHSMASMMDMHDTCDQERVRHHDAVGEATDLDDVKDEEEHHRLEMTSTLDSFGDLMDQMADDYEMVMCHGHHGMDDHPRGHRSSV